MDCLFWSTKLSEFCSTIIYYLRPSFEPPVTSSRCLDRDQFHHQRRFIPNRPDPLVGEPGFVLGHGLKIEMQDQIAKNQGHHILCHSVVCQHISLILRSRLSGKLTPDPHSPSSRPKTACRHPARRGQISPRDSRPIVPARIVQARGSWQPSETQLGR
jgi:hypothetical protein